MNIKTKRAPASHHLSLKLIAGAVVLVALSLFVMNASRPGQKVEGCPVECGRAAVRNGGALRLGSLNMLHGFPSFKDLPLRLALIAREVQRRDLDIVLLQEVPWTMKTGNGAEMLAKDLNYNYLYYRANGNKSLIFFEEGEAILSRFPLKEPRFIELRPRLGLFESRVSLGAIAVTPEGDVSVFVTHLTDKEPAIARGQAESLKQFVSSYATGSTLVAGDFNSKPDSPQIMDLSRAWVDTYQAMHQSDTGLTCCVDNLQNGPTEPLEERIDYIFMIPGDGKLLHSEKIFDQPFPVSAGWQWASDHIGLMVEVVP